MKNKSVLWIILLFAAFCLIGCSTTPKIKDIPYSFAETEDAKKTATIVFADAYWDGRMWVPQIRVIDFDGEQLPSPAENTRWYPLQFPAGRAFDLRVYVVYRKDEPGFRRRGVFICPPLEAGKKYKLWYEPTKKDYYSGAGRLILTYDNVKELKYLFGSPRYKQICVQEIPPL
jgi:hypothetical protein